MTAHLPPEVVSDLASGLLEDRDAAAASAHLSTCAECAATRAALDSVRRRLASAESGPLPADIAARLDATLTAEAARRSPGRDATGEYARRDPPGRVARPRSAPSVRGRFLPAWLLPAAAALALVVGTGAVLVSSRDQGSGSASSAAGAPATTAAPGGAQSTTLVPPVTSSGRNYSSADLPTAARALLASSGTPPESPPERAGTAAGEAQKQAQDAAPGAGAGEPSGIPPGAAIEGCLHGLGVAGRVLRLDVGTFRGSAALLVVAVAADDPAELDVRLVGTDCRAADPHQLAATRTGRG